jgi:hypothetical protein
MMTTRSGNFQNTPCRVLAFQISKIWHILPSGCHFWRWRMQKLTAMNMIDQTGQARRAMIDKPSAHAASLPQSMRANQIAASRHRGNCRPHTFARFSHSLISKPNNRHGRQAIGNMYLNRDGNRLNAPKCDRMNFCMH